MVQYTYSSHRTRQIEKIAKQRVKYPQVAKNIVDTSDIILQVLDARFIDETRNLALEEEIDKQKKKIIHVLNKSDLISKSKLREVKGKFYPFVAVSCIDKSGIKSLRSLIKRIGATVEKREKLEILKDKVVMGNDHRLKVGVIGYPNAGKSSLLNILAGKAAAGVGADAGFTRNVQKIRLTDDIILVDAPGVIPESHYSLTDKEKIANHTLAGGKSYTQTKEPDMVVMQLFKLHKEALQKFYKVEIEDSDELIQHVGEIRGLFKKGGIVNEDSAARSILKDWQFGKMRVGKSSYIKTMFEMDDVAREFAKLEQNEKNYAVSEVLDKIAMLKLKDKEFPVHIADLCAGAHPDRYHELFKKLSKNKSNKFDWVDSSSVMINLAKEYIESENLKRRIRALDFIIEDATKYLEVVQDNELDLILMKYAIDYILDLDEFFGLVSKKLKVGSSLVATLTMTSPVLKSISTNARFLHEGEEFPEDETRKLKEGEKFDIKFFKESGNPEAGYIKGAITTKVYHSEKKIKTLAKKHGLKCFVGSSKEYLNEEDSETVDQSILVLDK